MGERREYLLSNVPVEKIEEVKGILNTELGKKDKAQTFALEQDNPFTGEADIWQPDERCVLVFNETNAIHAAEIDEDSRLGKLLSELETLYSHNEEQEQRN